VIRADDPAAPWLDADTALIDELRREDCDGIEPEI